jgi:hypothetical protein
MSFDITPVAVLPAGGTPAVVQLFNNTQRSVYIYNTGATVYLGGGTGAGTAGITSANGWPLGSAATYGPIGPFTGSMYATSSSGTVTVFVTTYSP